MKRLIRPIDGLRFMSPLILGVTSLLACSKNEPSPATAASAAAADDSPPLLHPDLAVEDASGDDEVTLSVIRGKQEIKAVGECVGPNGVPRGEDCTAEAKKIESLPVKPLVTERSAYVDKGDVAGQGTARWMRVFRVGGTARGSKVDVIFAWTRSAVHSIPMAADLKGPTIRQVELGYAANLVVSLSGQGFRVDGNAGFAQAQAQLGAWLEKKHMTADLHCTSTAPIDLCSTIPDRPISSAADIEAAATAFNSATNAFSQEIDTAEPPSPSRLYVLGYVVRLPPETVAAPASESEDEESGESE